MSHPLRKIHRTQPRKLYYMDEGIIIGFCCILGMFSLKRTAKSGNIFIRMIAELKHVDVIHVVFLWYFVLIVKGIFANRLAACAISIAHFIHMFVICFCLFYCLFNFLFHQT